MAELAPQDETLAGGIAQALAHDSAVKHVTGQARYIDDLAVPANCLTIHLIKSVHARAQITRLDLEAVRQAPGVACVLSAADIPGINDASPIMGDDPVFAEGEVVYAGQVIAAIAGETLDPLLAAAKLAVIEYRAEAPILTVEEAMAAESFVLPSRRFRLGDPEAALAAAPNRLRGSIRIGGQEHFYLEGHVALALPQEDGDMLVLSSTQHPSEVQHTVAKVLGLKDNAVTTEVRRMGGAFGGKESQAALIAAIAALVAGKTGRPAKLCLDRDDDMIVTGKRHDFRIDYDVGFDDAGRLAGIRFEQLARCGCSADLSAGITDRAMFHADNTYFLNSAEIVSHRLKTNTVSATAFRGFGGPQGMVAIERVMDAIALRLGKDPLAVRKANLYGGPGRDLTPYHMTVEDNVAPEIIAELEASSDYQARRAALRDFNRQSPVLKKGIALTPVKFGISFTATHLNQAGALLHIYQDGSVHLNHGGTEMGQGLYVKVAQVVAETLQIPLDWIKITATTTGKVPNTAPTAASSGSDLNGMAAQAAALTLKERLTDFAALHYKVERDDVAFLPGRVRVGNQEVTFPDLAKQAFMARVSLSATGFYKTPKIHWDPEANRGRAFYYFAYGAAVSEIVIDTLTGENRVLRCDILHDVGQSLNPAIDIGQIEGGFIQGMGWLTTEELWWDAEGHLKTHAPSTYKIPTASDRPDDLRVKIWEKGRNVEPTIYRSKAVGEPPLMLAISVFSAITDAIASLGDYKTLPMLDTPATPERILLAVEAIKADTAEEEAQ